MAIIHVHPNASCTAIARLAARMGLTPANENGRVVLQTPNHPQRPAAKARNVIRPARFLPTHRRGDNGNGPDEAA